jgi:hypothetical protein
MQDGAATGIIMLSGSSGPAIVDLFYTNAAGQIFRPGNGFGVGEYTATVINTDGCPSYFQLYVGPRVFIQWAPWISAPTPSCPTSPTGTIGPLTAKGGNPPYYYRYRPNSIPVGPEPWEGPFTGPHYLRNVPAGRWIVQVKDSSPTYAEDRSVEAIVDSLPVISPVFTDLGEDDGSSNGAFEITFTSGSPPYTITLNGGVVLTEPPYIFSSLSAGRYSVMIVDTWGCSLNRTYSVAPTCTSCPCIIFSRE